MADENLLGQADALIRRYRSFVARGPETSATLPASAGTPPEAEANIPLLTEVVAAADLPATRLTENLRAALENELAGWIGEILPQRVELLTAQIRADLLAGLSEEARESLLPRLIAALETLHDKA